MIRDQKESVRRDRLVRAGLCLSIALLPLVTGCGGKPSQANIQLRKENQDLRDQIAQLERAREADQATIRSLESSRGTIPTLPQERLERVFTTHAIRINRLSGGVKLNPDSPGDDGLKIYVVPTDGSGDELKAAGSFEVKAFDLASPDGPLVGRWEFDSDAARKSWYGEALLYEYVLTCPLVAPATWEQLTVHVLFTDELTGRKFEAQKIVRLTPAARNQSPATGPAINTTSAQP